MNHRTARASALAGLLIGGLLACTTALAGPAPDRAALQVAIRRWVAAVNAQDVPTLTRTMTADVELLDGTATVSGRDAAILALREAATRGRLDATSREISIAGDVAWHVVWLTQTRKNGDVQALGQALEIWKRDRGEWQLHRQIAAGVISPADRLTRPSTNEPVLDR